MRDWKEALIPLGKLKLVVFLGGAEPSVTWTLDMADGSVVVYRRFNPPFMLQVDEALVRCKNEKRRVFDKDSTLLPTEAMGFNSEAI